MFSRGMILRELALQNNRRTQTQQWINTGHHVFSDKENVPLKPIKFRSQDTSIVPDSTTGSNLTEVNSVLRPPDLSRHLPVKKIYQTIDKQSTRVQLTENTESENDREVHLCDVPDKIQDDDISSESMSVSEVLQHKKLKYDNRTLVLSEVPVQNVLHPPDLSKHLPVKKIYQTIDKQSTRVQLTENTEGENDREAHLCDVPDKIQDDDISSESMSVSEVLQHKKLKYDNRTLVLSEVPVQNVLHPADLSRHLPGTNVNKSIDKESTGVQLTENREGENNSEEDLSDDPDYIPDDDISSDSDDEELHHDDETLVLSEVQNVLHAPDLSRHLPGTNVNKSIDKQSSGVQLTENKEGENYSEEELSDDPDYIPYDDISSKSVDEEREEHEHDDETLVLSELQNVSHPPDLSRQLPVTKIDQFIDKQSTTGVTKACDRPSRPCPFCHKFKVRLTRHIKRVHKEENVVKMALHVNAKEQRILFRQCRRTGMMKYNMHKMGSKDGALLRERVPKSGQHKDGVVCDKCRGIFSRTWFYGHKKLCVGGNYTCIEPKPVPASVYYSSDKLSEDFKLQILSKFNQDQVGRICQTDSMVTMIGSKLYTKVKARVDKKTEVRRSVMADMRRLSTLYVHFKNAFGKETVTPANTNTPFYNLHK